MITAFQTYCELRKNILYECHGFWSLQQLEGESIDRYLTRFKIKVEACEYNKEDWPAAVRLEMLQDKFVFGLHDDSLKERLLRENELDIRNKSCHDSAKARVLQDAYQGYVNKT